jgi:hypothetical protein
MLQIIPDPGVLTSYDRESLQPPGCLLMKMHRMSNYPAIEVRGFKWPHRHTTTAVAHFLDEDEFGRWLGVARGNQWWAADRSVSGTFETSFVNVVPHVVVIHRYDILTFSEDVANLASCRRLHLSEGL